MNMPLASRRSVLVLVGAVGLAACSGKPPPGKTFYERNIQPILIQSCVRNTGGCHQADSTRPYDFALGNLDVTSFENVQKRRDLLQPFGPYSVPPLLIKATASQGLQYAYGGTFRDLEVQHQGGANLEIGSDAYLTLLSWMVNGATEDGLPPPTPAKTGTGACSTAVPPGFDPSPYTADANFAEFKSNVQPVLANCNSGNCHGAPQSDFYMTCGDDDIQVAFNFSQAWSFVNDPVDQSQFLRVPLAAAAGGGPHTGGDQFASTSDPKYTALYDWASKVGTLDFGAGDPGKQFFADNVQPVLIARGCSFPACHSPEATNDLNLRSGSNGFYSAIALQKNYDQLKDEFMAFEYPDARRGRAVAKTILPEFGGIVHRGSFALETAGSGGADPANCPATYDPATSSAFCTIQQWVDIERQSLLAGGEVTPMDPGDTVPIVYVQRQATDVTDPARVRHLPAQLRPDGRRRHPGRGPAHHLGRARRARCSTPARAPATGPWSMSARRTSRNDGTTVAFAMQTSASDPLGVYTVNIDGTGCQRITPAEPDAERDPHRQLRSGVVARRPVDRLRVDPGRQRGRPEPVAQAVPAPVRHLADEARRHRARPDDLPVELGDRAPDDARGPDHDDHREDRRRASTSSAAAASTGTGPTTTRCSPSARTRPTPIPTDLTVTHPSIGYSQATDIREGADGNFLLILSDVGAKGGAGTLATFNRSIGPFEQGRDDPGFLQSLHVIDPAATGRVGSPTQGAYRGPDARCPTARSWCRTPPTTATSPARPASTGTWSRSTPDRAADHPDRRRRRPGRRGPRDQGTRRTRSTSTAASWSSAARSIRPWPARTRRSSTSPTRR